MRGGGAAGVRALVLLLAVAASGCLGAAPDGQPAGGREADAPPGSPETEAGEAGPAPAAAPAQAAPPGPEVLRKEFRVEADGAKGALSAVREEMVDLDADLTGATAVVVELAWDSPVFDLDLFIYVFDACDEAGAPGDFLGCMPGETADHWLSGSDDGNYWLRGGHLGAPDSPVRLVVPAAALRSYGCAAACAADLSVVAKDAAAGVGGVLAVSVFRGAPVPDGYSALA